MSTEDFFFGRFKYQNIDLEPKTITFESSNHQEIAAIAFGRILISRATQGNFELNPASLTRKPDRILSEKS